MVNDQPQSSGPQRCMYNMIIVWRSSLVVGLCVCDLALLLRVLVESVDHFASEKSPYVCKCWTWIFMDFHDNEYIQLTSLSIFLYDLPC